MADVFQVVASALSIVQLAGVTIGLVRKLVTVEEDARIWLVKLEQMRELNEDILILMRQRQRQSRRAYTTTPTLEKRFEERIFKSISAAKGRLVKLNYLLSFLDSGSEDNQRITIPDRVKYLFDQGEIERQARLIDKHVDDVSLSLQLLLSVDQTATRELVQAIVELLDTDGRVLRHVSQPTDIDTTIPSPVTTHCPDRNQVSFSNLEEVTLPNRENPKPPAKRQAIIIAVKRNDLTNLEVCLRAPEAQGFLQAVLDEGWTALHWAVYHKAPEMLKRLLDAGLASVPGFIDKADDWGETALMKCAILSNTCDKAYQMAEMLVKTASDINFAARPGRTALCYAVGNMSKRGVALVDLLIENGAKVGSMSVDQKDLVQWLGINWPQLIERLREEQREGVQPITRRGSRGSFGQIGSMIRRTLTRDSQDLIV